MARLPIGLLTACALLGAAAPAVAQHDSKVHRIGFVSPIGEGAPTIAAFRDGLRDLGYVEGKNVVVEARFAAGHLDRLPGLMADVLRRNVEVLVTGSEAGTRAAKNATTTVPIVFAGVSDPLGTGLVTSLSHPGGNVTGVTFGIAGSSLGGKWMELLKEASPSLVHVAVVSNPKDPQTADLRAQIREAARALKIRLDSFDVASVDDLDPAFAAIAASGAQGMIVTNSPVFSANRARLVGFAAKRRLPAMYFFSLFADSGGLMSYGASLEESYRKAASLVVQIFRGGKPGGIPIEQPTAVELVVNLRTAKALGLTIPQALLLRADRVIE